MLELVSQGNLTRSKTEISLKLVWYGNNGVVQNFSIFFSAPPVDQRGLSPTRVGRKPQGDSMPCGTRVASQIFGAREAFGTLSAGEVSRVRLPFLKKLDTPAEAKIIYIEAKFFNTDFLLLKKMILGNELLVLLSRFSTRGDSLCGSFGPFPVGTGTSTEFRIDSQSHCKKNKTQTRLRC